MAAYRGVAPELAARAGYALGVELARYGLRGYARGNTLENAAHDLGLARVDDAFACDRCPIGTELTYHIIAIRLAAPRVTRLDPASQAAPCLVRQVLQKELVHRALEADMQLADLSLRQRDDAHAMKAQTFE